jgi:hypothetical protein
VRVVEPSETPFRVGVAVAALLVALLIARMRFCYSVEVPEMPPRPVEKKMSTIDVARAVESSPQFYAEYLVRDARDYGLRRAPTVEEMSRALPYVVKDLDLVLDPGDKKQNRGEALGLVFTASVQKVEGSTERQMLLSIENTTDRNFAYQVTTHPSKGVTPCARKRDLAHNAIALAPGVTETRSECLWDQGWTLTIGKVELIEIAPLSYRYVSQLPAGPMIGLDPRTSRGHVVPAGEPACRLFHSAEISNQMRGGLVTWRDMIDFYARHRCKTYTFSTGYRAIEAGKTVSLPAGATAR